MGKLRFIPRYFVSGLIDKLSQSFDVLDMSNNSIAKTHIRYMAGGRADAGNEVLYRFVIHQNDTQYC
jgi:hypothetical protein